MSTNDGLRQASVRSATGTAYDYNGDWMALFDLAAIPKGHFNGRLLAWINATLGASYSEINGAMTAFAVSQGVINWNSLGTFIPGAVAALLTDFVAGTYFVGGQFYPDFLSMPGASFTRASVGTATWADGHVSTFASGVPRITDQGLLVEESRTNLLLQSQQFTVSPWATAAGGTGTAPTVTDNAAAAPDGTQTAARIQFAQGAGTTINDFSGVQQTAVGTANPETHSIWLRSNTGSNQLVALRSLDLAADFTVVTATTTWQRFTFTSTATTTSAGLQLIVRGTYGTTSAADVLAWGAQLEQASFATSYIPTTSAAATRAAENVNIAGLSIAAPYTAYEEVRWNALATNATATGVIFGEGNTASGFGFSFSSAGSTAKPRLIQRTGANSAARTDTQGGAASQADGQITKMALGTDGASAASAVNGASLGNLATPIQSDFVGPLYIGARGGGSNFSDAYIRRLSVQASFSAARLQALTQ